MSPRTRPTREMTADDTARAGSRLPGTPVAPGLLSTVTLSARLRADPRRTRGACHVVGEQLQRRRHDDRRTARAPGGRTARARRGADLFVALARDGDHLAPRGAHLLDVREHLRVDVALGRDGDDGDPVLHEGDRAVLQLAGRVPLGVQVRELLQLERALQRRRISRAPPEEQDVGGVADLAAIAATWSFRSSVRATWSGRTRILFTVSTISTGTSTPRTCARYSATRWHGHLRRESSSRRRRSRPARACTSRRPRVRATSRCSSRPELSTPDAARGGPPRACRSSRPTGSPRA